MREQYRKYGRREGDSPRQKIEDLPRGLQSKFRDLIAV